jgi:hypothetical protein
MTTSSCRTFVTPVLKVTVASAGTFSSAPLPAAMVFPRVPVASKTSRPMSTGVVPRLVHTT